MGAQLYYLREGKAYAFLFKLNLQGENARKFCIFGQRKSRDSEYFEQMGEQLYYFKEGKGVRVF